MSAQHTPGPWAFALIDSDPNEAFVQWAYGYAAVHGSRAGREANARLIAAAPNLLEVLCWAFDAESLKRENNEPGWSDDLRAAALAAITKATGKE